MSLRSTLTNASINGWSAKSGFTLTQQQIIPNPGGGQEFFQLAMSGNGKTIVSRTKSIGGIFNAIIYIYNKDINDVWQYTTYIALPVNASWIDISNDGLTFVVGSYNVSGAGVAYVYVNSAGTWTLESSITPSDTPQPYFGIGASISDDGNTIVIGCPREGSTNYGSAYIFTRSGSVWTQQQKIVAGDQATNDYFGTSVSINADGTILTVGAPQGGLVASTTYGKAYIFTKSGSVWTQQQKITAPVLGTLRNFGQRMKISSDGSTVLVGGTGATDSQTSTTYGGKNVYVFYYNGSTWTNTQILSSSAVTYGFGSDMCMNNNGSIIFVGNGTKISPYSGTNNIVSVDTNNTTYVYGGNNGSYSLLQSIVVSPPLGGEFAIGMYLTCDSAGETLMLDSSGISAGNPGPTNMYYYSIT